MKNTILIMILMITSGCTQVVTAPLKITGAVVSSTIDIVGATANAVSDKEDEDTASSED